ncbi:MAG: glycosyltransferase [Hydrogenovibrio sp.]|uniref:glycosyltransferase n=1 Tax=Hydrogenovibrio sp. TaxID=2065821 RepID=UPI00286FBA35|nr:glycosyltransferase [Hydrogenovibrio sp.]MDR9500049.1 glycosyltransferase [Hydrogenovibrio sp.]
MKILVVANGFVKAGVSRVLSLLTEQWEQSHDVEVAFFKPVDQTVFPIKAKIVQQNITLPKCILSQVAHLYALLKRKEYDIIIGFSEDANYPLSVASRLASVAHKTILSVHNTVQTMSPKVLARIRNHYPHVKKVVAVSEGVKDGLIRAGVPAKKVAFAPNPIDLYSIDRLRSKVCAMVRNPTNFIFVAMGRLHNHKGFDLLIDAFHHAAVDGAQLWIIGEGAERKNLQNQINSLELTNSVFLLGVQDNPFPTIEEADVFVFSSRFEGWGLALAEAMACEKPCIAFNCPNGPGEMIEHNLSGVLVECQDVEGLSYEMKELSGDSALRERFSRNARNRIEKFDVQKVATKWLEV